MPARPSSSPAAEILDFHGSSNELVVSRGLQRTPCHQGPSSGVGLLNIPARAVAAAICFEFMRRSERP